MPARAQCAGQTFEHVETFKHDFFAATGLYRCGERLAILKLGRQSDLLTIPMAWLGRFLTRREARMYSELNGTPGIPAYIGTLPKEAGFLHEFVPGHPMARNECVGDEFFGQLQALLSHLHERQIAYVDLNKRQNVLVGDDGRPYLIDFQISLQLPRGRLGRMGPLRWLLARFQHGDRYHVLKHKRRLRPDMLTAEERAELERLSVWIRLHRWVSRPITNLRRRTLKRLARSEEFTVAGASAK